MEITSLPFCMKGIEQFQQALEISPDCVPAQYGLALGLLCSAKDCINLGAYQWGASLLEVFFSSFLFNDSTAFVIMLNPYILDTFS